jgi:hypothetical protein
MPDTHAEQVIRSALKAQYHAALEMLRTGVNACPDDLWLSTSVRNAPWQIAYHTVYFTHLYLHRTSAEFRTWEGHQGGVQHEDGIEGPDDPASGLPLLPQPYSREQVLGYVGFVDSQVDAMIDGIDVLSANSGFDWYKIPKLEHQIVNIRHLQLGAAHLAARLRAELDVGLGWVGSRPGAP